MTPGKIPGNWSVFKDITQKALKFLKIRKFTDESKKLCKNYVIVYHGPPYYIWISEPSQPFRSQFVLYRTDIGLIKQTINRTSRCNKVDAVRLYASYMLNLLLLKGQRCVIYLSWTKKEKIFPKRASMDPFGAQIIKNLNVLKTDEFPLS